MVVHFQTQSDPIHIETSHIPSQPGEVSFTQTQDEPHRVIHEVIRPVIQEIREIIQPYRRVTQEIRPVQEQVHTDVAANAVAPAPVVVSAPAVVEKAVVAAPAVVSAPAPVQTPIQYNYAIPQQQWSNQWLRSNYGVIQAPSTLFSGSYIQQFIDNMRSRQPVVVAQPKAIVAASAPAVSSVTYADADEPIPSESQNVDQKVVPNKVGIVHFSRKYQ